ncbi:MAG: hypothetical protein BroJett018_35230 [Chloroflexota bacterium]|nr:hypothetical protein [Chloroflexota bacterium]NOG63967.1 hypothetical protein [Chloroflexota bacterium]GIK65729.1 MAG: hypothetical protein BroJett018_35230 [Chloroflexota bacterium]
MRIKFLLGVMLIVVLIAQSLAHITPPNYVHSQDSPPSTIESDDPRVARAGTWLTQAADGASGGTYLYSTGSEADVLTLVFSGPTIEIVYLAGPHLGTLALEVDDTVLRTVITTSDQTAYHQTTTLNYLTDEPHTLRVYAQEGGVVAVDAFVATLPDDEGEAQSQQPYDTQNQIVYNCSGAYQGRLCTTYEAVQANPITSSTVLSSPQWSPDGSSVLYTFPKPSYPSVGPYGIGILTRNSDGTWSGGSSGLWTWDSRPESPAWSPDGTRIVYEIEIDPYAPDVSGPALYVVDLTDCDTSRASWCLTTPLTEDMNPATGDGLPDWSPDGMRIVFNRNNELYTVRPNGSDLAPVTYNVTPPAGISFGDAEWSPDGTKLLVVGKSMVLGNSATIYILTVNTSGASVAVTNIQQAVVPPSGYTDLQPTWAWDGMHIAFTRYTIGPAPSYIPSDPNIRIATYNTTSSSWIVESNIAISGYSPSWRQGVIQIEVLVYQDSSGSPGTTRLVPDDGSISPRQPFWIEIRIANNLPVPVTVNSINYWAWVADSLQFSRDAYVSNPMVFLQNEYPSGFTLNSTTPQSVNWGSRQIAANSVENFTRFRATAQQSGFIETWGNVNVSYLNNNQQTTTDIRFTQVFQISLTQLNLVAGGKHEFLKGYMFWALWYETSGGDFFAGPDFELSYQNHFPSPGPDVETTLDYYEQASDIALQTVGSYQSSCSTRPPVYPYPIQYMPNFTPINGSDPPLNPSIAQANWKRIVYCENPYYLAAQTIINGILLNERINISGESVETVAVNYFDNFKFDTIDPDTGQKITISVFESRAQPWPTTDICKISSGQGVELYNLAICLRNSKELFAPIYWHIMPEIERAINDFYSRCETTYNPNDPLYCDPTDGAANLKTPPGTSAGGSIDILTSSAAQGISDQWHNDHRGNLNTYIPTGPSLLQPVLVLELDAPNYTGIKWTSWIYQRNAQQGQSLQALRSQIMPRYYPETQPYRYEEE